MTIPDRWEGRVSLGSGRRLNIYGASRQDVERQMREALHQRDRGLDPAPASLTVGHYLDRWVQGKVHELRPSTARRYREIVRLHLVPLLGSHVLGRLGPRDVEVALQRMVASGKSPLTASHAKTVLGTALGDAMRDGKVARNAGHLARAPKYERHEVQVLAVEQVRHLMASVDDDPLGPLVVTAMGTGLRQGELLGLRWPDVDLEAGTLRVRKALQRVDGEWQLVDPKTDRSRRTVPLPGYVGTTLRKHRVTQLQWRLSQGSGWRPVAGMDDLVFPSLAGTPQDGTNVGKRFQALLARAGLPRMRFHDLRHQAASLAIASGAGLREVMGMLGHSQIAITADLYSHLLPGVLRGVADRMDALLADQRPKPSDEASSALQADPEFILPPVPLGTPPATAELG